MKLNAKDLYHQLSAERSGFITEAERAAKLTLPWLFIGDKESSTRTLLPSPYQSDGAAAVDSLSSKITLALFPPNQPFFQFAPSERVAQAMEAVSPGSSGETRKELLKVERQLTRLMESTATRPSVDMAIKHLLVTGNVLVYVTDTLSLRLFPLNRYVVKRDVDGSVLQIVTLEHRPVEALTEKQKQRLTEARIDITGKRTVELHTAILRDVDRNVFDVHQELEGIHQPEHDRTETVEGLRWIPVRVNAVGDETYGRGRVEIYIGDIQSLEGLTESIIQGAAMAAQVRFLKKSGSVVNMDDLFGQPNGGWTKGDAEDVTVLQLEKYPDWSFASGVRQELRTQLAAVFLRTQSIQRDAERVTAEEIRILAQELETQLGGMYSLLAVEFQLPLVKAMKALAEKKNMLPRLPDAAEVRIVTGLDALGRTADLGRLQTLLQIAQQTLGPEELARRLNGGEALRRMADALAIDVDGLVLSDAEVQENAAQAQIAELAKGAVPGLTDAFTQTQQAQ